MCAVLQAEAIALASLTANRLKKLVMLCEEYSCRLKSQYNPVKSKVFICGDCTEDCKLGRKCDSPIMSNNVYVKS